MFQGERGFAGERGATGQSGAPGEMGPMGAAGDDGQPVGTTTFLITLKSLIAAIYMLALKPLGYKKKMIEV